MKNPRGQHQRNIYIDKEPAKIRIHIVEGNDWIKVNIKNNNPGINIKDQTKICDFLTSTSNIDTNGFQGTGIGIAIVKSLIESLGGKTSVQSENGNGGNSELYIAK